ncbi:MAG: RHS repeat-associated core domain-containing protein [Phototrophicaceae bacterium]
MYLLEDGLGSIRGLVNAQGSPTETTTYTPFGQPEGTRLSGTDFGFTGEHTDETELLYLRARYYAPNAGVFTALDPFEGLHCTPMSLNGYSWVEGDPINRIDPTGRVATRQPRLYSNSVELARTLNGGSCGSTLISYQPGDEELPEWWTTGCAIFGDADEQVGSVTGIPVETILDAYRDTAQRYPNFNTAQKDTYISLVNNPSLDRVLTGLDAVSSVTDILKAICEIGEGDFYGFVATLGQIAAEQAIPGFGIVLWVVDVGASAGLWPDFVDEVTEEWDNDLQDSIRFAAQAIRNTDPVTPSGPIQNDCGPNSKRFPLRFDTPFGSIQGLICVPWPEIPF